MLLPWVKMISVYRRWLAASCCKCFSASTSGANAPVPLQSATICWRCKSLLLASLKSVPAAGRIIPDDACCSASRSGFTAPAATICSQRESLLLPTVKLKSVMAAPSATSVRCVPQRAHQRHQHACSHRLPANRVVPHCQDTERHSRLLSHLDWLTSVAARAPAAPRRLLRQYSCAQKYCCWLGTREPRLPSRPHCQTSRATSACNVLGPISTGAAAIVSCWFILATSSDQNRCQLRNKNISIAMAIERSGARHGRQGFLEIGVVVHTA